MCGWLAIGTSVINKQTDIQGYIYMNYVFYLVLLLGIECYSTSNSCFETILQEKNSLQSKRIAKTTTKHQ